MLGLFDALCEPSSMASDSLHQQHYINYPASTTLHRLPSPHTSHHPLLVHPHPHTPSFHLGFIWSYFPSLHLHFGFINTSCTLNSSHFPCAIYLLSICYLIRLIISDLWFMLLDVFSARYCLRCYAHAAFTISFFSPSLLLITVLTLTLCVLLVFMMSRNAQNGITKLFFLVWDRLLLYCEMYNASTTTNKQCEEYYWYRIKIQSGSVRQTNESKTNSKKTKCWRLENAMGAGVDAAAQVLCPHPPPASVALRANLPPSHPLQSLWHAWLQPQRQ